MPMVGDSMVCDDCQLAYDSSPCAKYEALLQRALEALEKADVDLNANGLAFVNLETVRALRAALHQQGGK